MPCHDIVRRVILGAGEQSPLELAHDLMLLQQTVLLINEVSDWGQKVSSISQTVCTCNQRGINTDR
jgi:hypothetical protein